MPDRGNRELCMYYYITIVSPNQINSPNEENILLLLADLSSEISRTDPTL